MDLPSTLAARRVCYLAGRAFWVRPASLEAMAEVVAWLDDMLPGDREMPPRLSDPAAQEALNTPAGQALIAWLALRDSGIGYEQAADLWRKADEPERGRLVAVLFHRRRSLRREGGPAEDIGELWCGKEFAGLMSELGVDAVRALSLDQVEFILSGGECDRHADPGQKALAEAQRIWEEQQAAKKAAATDGTGAS